MKKTSIFTTFILTILNSFGVFSQNSFYKNPSVFAYNSTAITSSLEVALPQSYTTKPKKAFSSGYDKGDKLLNAGVGLSSYYYGFPVGLSYETGVGIDDNITIGGQFDFNTGNYGSYYYNDRYTAFYVGARASYHVNELLKIKSEKIDLYAGVGIGFKRFRWKDSSYIYDYYGGGNIFFNYFVGGRYYFSDKFGAFVELGYTGLSSSRVGLTLKM